MSENNNNTKWLKWIIIANSIIAILWLGASIWIHGEKVISNYSWKYLFHLSYFPFIKVVPFCVILSLMVYLIITKPSSIRKVFHQFNITILIVGSLSLLFYFILGIVLIGSKYSFQDDNTILFIGLIPIIIATIIYGIQNFSSLTFKLPGFEVSMEKQFENTFTEVKLQEGNFEKGSVSKLKEKLQSLRKSHQPINYLTVAIPNDVLSQKYISIIHLRFYVYILSFFPSFRYIIFTDGQKKYFGFMSVNDFKSLFPEIPGENLYYRYQELECDWGNSHELYEIDYARIRNFTINLYRQMTNGSPRRDQVDRLNIDDLKYLHIKNNYLPNSASIFEKFKNIISNNLEGIPVTDKDHHFLGMMIWSEFVNQFLLSVFKKQKI